MKAFHLNSFTGADGIELCDQTLPSPGRGQVLVRVHASAINFRDLAAANGVFGDWVRRGVVPLSDAAGEVTEVGEKVTRYKVGDRVALTFFEDWIAGEKPSDSDPFGRGFLNDGVLTEFVVVNEQGLVKVPDHLSFEEAATLPCAAVTAWAALVGNGILLPGETVLVQGTGGVSIFALQLAKLFGAQVIATTSCDRKAQRLKTLGADAVINYREHPNWDQQVQELTGGRGADVVVDVGGATTIARSAAAARFGGRVSSVGLLTGSPHEGLGNAGALFSRAVHLHPVQVGSRAHFEAMNRAITYHQLRPVIDQVFSFEQAPEALRHLASQTHIGKIVIRHRETTK